MKLLLIIPNNFQVLQEALISKAVRFAIGSLTFSPLQLEHALRAATTLFEGKRTLGSIEFDPFWNSEGYRIFHYMSNFREEPKSVGLSLHSMLCNLRMLNSQGRLRASDPRDLVFALLGISHEDDRSKVLVDYSLPAETVFTLTARAIISGSGSLEGLATCDGTGRASAVAPSDSLILPTWVPDWSRGQDRRFVFLRCGTVSSARTWDVCAGRHHVSDKMTRIDQLHVRGKAIGKVQYSLPRWLGSVRLCYDTALFGPQYCDPHREALHSLQHKFELITGYSVDEQRLLQVFLSWALHELHTPLWGLPNKEFVDLLLGMYDTRCQQATTKMNYLPTICEDAKATAESCRTVVAERNISSYRCIHSIPIFEKDEECTINCEDSYLRAWSAGSKALDQCDADALFLCTDGKLILSLSNVEPGDGIYVLHGCFFPVVLRKLDSGHFQYVGGCCVEGGMDLVAERVTWEEDEADDIVLV